MGAFLLLSRCILVSVLWVLVLVLVGTSIHHLADAVAVVAVDAVAAVDVVVVADVVVDVSRIHKYDIIWR
jgi:hypothetical protein